MKLISCRVTHGVTHLPYVVKVLMITAAYCLMGRFSLLFVVPPGYATAVWLPSGIALAGLLVWGYRVWPGVVLGSLLITVWMFIATANAPTLLLSVVLTASVTLAVVLQALAGAFLIRRFVGFPCSLERGKDIGMSLLLGGPVSCLIAATVSVTALCIGGMIPWKLALFHYWTWWLGDTLGVLIVIPLVLVGPAGLRQLWQRQWLSVAVPLLATFVGAAIFFTYASTWQHERIKLVFEQQAGHIGQTLERKVDDYLEILRSIQALYASSAEVTRQEFRTFVARALARHAGIQALSWNLYVSDAERHSVEEAARRDGYVDFQITERGAQGRLMRAAQRPTYVVVYYIEPYEGNEVALGYDVASQPARLEALHRARDTGEPTATSRITLVQEMENQFGFLVFVPIYRNGLPHGTVAERRQHLHGYAVGVFRIGDMIETALQPFVYRGIELRIDDETALEGQQFLYSSHRRTQGGKEAANATAYDESPAGLRWSTTLEVAGRRWLLRQSPTPQYYTGQWFWEAYLPLHGGFLLTGLLGVFLLVLSGRATTIEARTAALARANVVLEREVAERQSVEVEREQLIVDLEAKNAELERFAYTVSHDLKSPLITIKGFLGLLKKDTAAGDTELMQQDMAHLTHAADTMSQLLEDLLALSRIGRVVNPPEEVALRELAHEALKLVRGRYMTRRVQVDIAPDLPVVFGDRVRLLEVFQNLLDNAFKFLGDNPQPHVAVGIRQDGEDSVYYVQDNGIGIDPRYHEKVFGLFERLEPEREGTGIGLALVKRIIEVHGGRVWIESAGPGYGCTVCFTLAEEKVATHHAK